GASFSGRSGETASTSKPAAHLPSAVELCPRAVVLSDGVIVAGGSTYGVLTDDALRAEHRLELPFGFDPRALALGAGGYPEPRQHAPEREE
nr:hypothetical protein [Nocardioidaceae bacterium]